MSGKLDNQKHDSGFGKTGICVMLSILKSCHGLYVKEYVLDIALLNFPHCVKTDLADREIVIDVLIMNGLMKNHHLTSFYKKTQEINMGIQDVPCIQSKLLIEYQMHKENDDHFHEYVKAKPVISSGGDKIHDQVVKDEETLCEDMLYATKGEGLYDDNIHQIGTKSIRYSEG